jgi:hypothetical protein
VHWILELEIAAWARREGTSVDAAEASMPLDHATLLGDELVRTTLDDLAPD